MGTNEWPSPLPEGYMPHVRTCPMVRGMSAHGVRTWRCPVYFSTRDNLPGHLAICVNNVIIMCIGLVNDIFTRNIYCGVDMKIDN